MGAKTVQNVDARAAPLASDFLQILIYLTIILAGTPLLGGYMARVFAGERTLLSPVLVPLERTIYRACGIDPGKDQRWTRYARAPGGRICATQCPRLGKADAAS